MITFPLILLAAILKAVSDTVLFRYDTSVFKHLTPKFWNPIESYKYVGRVFSYPVDAWHLANSGMIVCFIIAAVFNDISLKWYYQIPALGICFNLIFNLFFNKILR
jgi:hypothetical protein